LSIGLFRVNCNVIFLNGMLILVKQW